MGAKKINSPSRACETLNQITDDISRRQEVPFNRNFLYLHNIILELSVDEDLYKQFTNLTESTALSPRQAEIHILKKNGLTNRAISVFTQYDGLISPESVFEDPLAPEEVDEQVDEIKQTLEICD